MLDGYPVRASHPNVFETLIRILGVNDADPTKEKGAGVTVTRVSEGLYRITWAEDPGVFMTAHLDFMAATPADLQAYKYVFTPYDATNRRLDVSIYASAAGSITDLVANQYAVITVKFARDF